MKKIMAGMIMGSLLFFAGCGDLHQPVNEQVDGGEVVVDLDGNTIKQSLLAASFPGVDENTTVCGYKAFKIPYITTDEEGNEVAVSGLMAIPTGICEAFNTIGFSVVSDDHGTIFKNAEAPVVDAETNNAPSGAAIIMTSLSAFVTLEPDYIGFGDSNDHYHPFVLKKSLANATVDFIVAAREFALKNNIRLNGQLYLTGYSEGGFAAMATLQKIEMEHLDINVTLAAPMAGPYDMNTSAFGVLSQPTLVVPSFVADIGYAYAKASHQPLDSVFNEPYGSKLDSLFDGSLDRTEIDPQLTTKTTGDDGLFRQDFHDNFFIDPNQWFRQAVVENSVHAWAPQTRVRLIHCRGDEVIPYTMSLWTRGTMKTIKPTADVEVVPVEDFLGIPYDVGHADCGPIAYGVAAQIFAAERNATIGY
ncbi:MAG: hypothetical protein IE885_05070 [Campylobacterales bacterium]|nr:hypothetical protein [Campylobacterales bacterium]